MVFEKIEIIGVPIDICAPENFEKAIMELLARDGAKQIVFLSVWNLLKARGKNDYADTVRNADLVLPVSKSILWAAKFLKKLIPTRYNQFSTVIQILSTLEAHFKSVYLLGGRRPALQKAESNVRATFPSLHVVGRYTGYFPKTSESAIIEAIHKSSPSLVIVSDGIKEKDCWSFRRRENFSSSIFLYYRDAIGIFSERKKRVSEKTFERGHEIFHEVFHNPLKIFLLFPFIMFVILIFWHRIFKK